MAETKTKATEKMERPEAVYYRAEICNRCGCEFNKTKLPSGMTDDAVPAPKSPVFQMKLEGKKPLTYARLCGGCERKATRLYDEAAPITRKKRARPRKPAPVPPPPPQTGAEAA